MSAQQKISSWFERCLTLGQDPQEWRALRKLPLLDQVLLPLLLFFFLAFELVGSDFAKKGITLKLPAAAGAIPHMQPKLFVMELLTAFLGLALLFRWKALKLPRRLSMPLLFGIGFVVWAGICLVVNVHTPLLLTIRNSSFVWGLAFPLLLALYPVSAEALNCILKVALVALSFSSALYISMGFLFLDPHLVLIFADLGCVFTYAYGFYSKDRKIPVLALIILGMTFVLGSFTKVQRTMLMGSVLFLTLLPFVHRYVYGTFNAFPWRRLLIFLVSIPVALGVFLLAAKNARKDLVPRNPVNQMEAVGKFLSYDGKFTAGEPDAVCGFAPVNTSGVTVTDGGLPWFLPIEAFRWFLWYDAYLLAKTHPIFGIGFAEQVVTRVYFRNACFKANDGGFEKKGVPPISGPHNSYLNAFARTGILGGALLLLLHLSCLAVLFKKQYWAAACVMYGQMVYALFNVGLEGPVRAYPGLLCIAIALKLASDGIGTFRRA